MSEIKIFIEDHRLRFVVVGVECGDGGWDVLAPLVRFRLGEVSGVVGCDAEAVAVWSLSLRPELDPGGSKGSIHAPMNQWYTIHY